MTRATAILALLACLTAILAIAPGCDDREQPPVPPRDQSSEDPDPQVMPPQPAEVHVPTPPEEMRPPAITPPVISAAPTEPTEPAAPTEPPVSPPSENLVEGLPLPEETADTQPDKPPSAPLELNERREPVAGEWAVYRTTRGGPDSRLRRQIESLDRNADSIKVKEQVYSGDEPIGPSVTMALPAAGRLWPAPMETSGRSVRYDREQIRLGGRDVDCILLTVESRQAGSLTVKKQWFCSQVPIDGLMRTIVSVNGREELREELERFGREGESP